MTRSARLAALALAGLLALTACGDGTTTIADPTSPQLKTLDAGQDGLIAGPDRQPLPALAGPTLEGGRLDVAAYRGQVVVLNFWASWCPPCRAETPVLLDVAAKTKALGVQFIGVNVKNDKSDALAFERKQGVTYPSLYDQPGELLLRFRKIVPQQPPTTLIVDRQGRIAAAFFGAVRISDLLEPVQQIAAEA